MKLTDEMVTRLRKLAARGKAREEEQGDDFNAYESSGGNYDDAYDMGRGAGEEDLAQEILNSVKE